MDGDPPVETSGAANREARQQAARQRGLVDQQAAARRRGNEAARPPLGCSISTARSRQQPARSASKVRTGPPSEEWTVDGIGGSGSVVGCLGAAPERGCQGILFGGEYDDSGWGVLDGWRAGSRIGPPLTIHRQHNTNTNRTTQMPHLGYRPTQPHHASSHPVTRPQHGAQGRSSGQGF